jgi:hypothetical protein
MLNRRIAKVLDVTATRQGIQEAVVDINGEKGRAINYPDLTGEVTPGDEVVLNTTAVDLGLGTGGVHFVMANLTSPTQKSFQIAGHIMKLRYTPVQKAVLSAEEDASPCQEAVSQFQSLEGLPVVCCELHSQIAPVCTAIKAATNYKSRVAYVMTDGAALPIAFSRLVAELKEKNLLDATITCGQAFGADIEAINLYTGLIAAKEVARANCIVVSQGPGNAGTGTTFGFSGIQQGEAINAAYTLGGMPIAVLRISFADPRERHRGISHHTLTILSKIVLVPALVAVPLLPEDKASRISEALDLVINDSRYKIRVVDGQLGVGELVRLGVNVTTMGRSIEEDKEFFLAASAGGALAAELLSKSEELS